MTTWNQRTKITTVGVALQTTPGVFVAPTQGDLLAVSTPANDLSAIVATDPTATGAIFEAPPIVLGQTGTAGGTIPLRGYGAATPPAASVYVPGRILQAAGFAEIRYATADTQNVNGSNQSTTVISLNGAESTIDDALLGAVLYHPALGTGIRGYTQIIDYGGNNRTAVIPELLAAAVATGTSYTIPPQLSYVRGTQTIAPPLLSISVWRDKTRFDYVDCRITQLVIDIPVANEANQSFPSIQFSAKGNPLGVFDDVTPQLTATQLAVPIPPARGGKFVLDRVPLGHQSCRYTQGGTVAAASNQNADAGQDGYDILSATGTFDLDLNQMAVADFNVQSRVKAQTNMPLLSLWGLGVGNRFAFSVPNVRLNPLSPGDRNGYVNLTGQANSTDIDKACSLAIF